VVAGVSKQEWPPLLRLGFHDLDAGSRRRICLDRFQESITRKGILANLESIIDLINRQAITGEIWIDGSFLTEKLNPDDVDLAFVISRAAHLGMNAGQQQFFDGLNDSRLYDQYRLDSYGITIDQGTDVGRYVHAYWLRQFGFSRSDQPKGIIRVSVPYVVTP
jgi:hypothetical protein